jgi:hypothetical protein
MRVAMLLITLLLATGATAGEPQAPPAMGAVIGAEGSSPVCRDRILEVRREFGKPALERDAAQQDPLLIAAVDKRIGGCSVLVMRNDTSDIRPLPAPQKHRLMPAK